MPIPDPIATHVQPRPTTLSARAAERLSRGPLDPVTLMRDVCQVSRLQLDAAERMAQALLGTRQEFERLPNGCWALRSAPGCHPSPQSNDLHKVAFAVVDVETTGSRAGQGDRITEIGIVTVQGGKVGDSFVQLVNPERHIPQFISRLTQITWDMVRDQPRFANIAPDVAERLRGHVFTAHNANFDWRFVSEELSRGIGQGLYGPRLCTVRLARLVLPHLRRRSLAHLTHYFGVSMTTPHRAGVDALATAQVLIRLLDIAGEHGYASWEQLQAALGGQRKQRRTRKLRRAMPAPVQEDNVA